MHKRSDNLWALFLGCFQGKRAKVLRGLRRHETTIANLSGAIKRGDLLLVGTRRMLR